jgi:Bacterial Ig domain
VSLTRRVSNALRVAVPMALFASLVGTATPAQAVVYPYVHITSPGATSSSAGTTAFQFSAAVDPNGIDTIASFHLVVDGSSYGGSLGCPSAGSTSCSAQLLWEAQAPSGTTASHSVRVEMDTTHGAAVLSSAVSVTATHATATPVISSPLAGATMAAGDVFVEADASFTAPRYGDVALSIALEVDGAQVDFDTCDGMTADTGCPTELYWDASSAARGAHTLQVKLSTTSGGVWTSALTPITVVDAPLPSVTITSPAANSTVSGAVTVVATGSVDGTSGDTPQLMALFVDDRKVGPDEFCPATGATCTLSFPWDASGLAGSHTVVVGFATDNYTVFSGPTVVTVTSPRPTVTVSLPADLFTLVGGITLVRGVIQVTVTGTIDASQTDTARDLQLFVNGQPWGVAQPCPAAGQTCTATFAWDTASLDGIQRVSLSGRFTTAHATTTSLPRYVNVLVDPSLPGNTRVGVGGTTVNGVNYAQVGVSDKNFNPLVGVPVTVTVKPAIGPAYTLTGTTAGPYGEAQLPLGRHVTSILTATLSSSYGSATKSRKFIVQAVASCRLPKTVTHGRTTYIACKGSRVAVGTKVTLYFKYPHAGVHVLGHARFDAKGHATISFVSRVRKEKVQLWAQVANSALYSGTGNLPVLVRMI